jgi:hypothetical protein
MINNINKERRRSMNATPHTTQQQDPVARSPGGLQTKTGQGTGQSPDSLITKMINNLQLRKKINK